MNTSLLLPNSHEHDKKRFTIYKLELMLTCQKRRTSTKFLPLLMNMEIKVLTLNLRNLDEAFIFSDSLQYSREKIYTHYAKTALREGFDGDNTEISV